MPRIIDISVPINPAMPTWPGDPEVRVERRPGEPFISELHLGTHTGTHVDPPAHFFAGAATVEQLPLEALVGPAVVVDCSAGSGAVGVPDLEAAVPPECSRVLVKTSAGPGGERALRGLSPEAAEWLVSRPVRLVGIDTLSVDGPATTAFPAHTALLAARVVIVEGLDLSAAPAGPAMLCCLPLAITGADGAPARAVLILDE